MMILVLAGGYDQIALIKEIKKYDNRVLLADYFENPPAKKYADEFFKISTLDEAAIFSLAKEKQVDLITTACTDQALLTVARVSEMLGLPCYISSKTAQNVTNKAYMKRMFEKNNIPTAEFYVLNNGNMDLIDRIQKRGQYPYIVKPCDCNSSKGVIKVIDKEQLKQAVKNAFDLSRSKKVIVERYIEGAEISIDAWVDMGKCQILSMSKTNKILENETSFTIYQSEYPTKISDKIFDKMKVVLDKICQSFKLENCPLLVQAIVDEENLYVIEFSTRMGGGSKYKFMEYISGIDIIEKYVDFILGRNIIKLRPRISEKFYEIDYIYAKAGIISKLINFEEFKQIGLIKELFMYKSKGDVIKKMETSSDRILGMMLEANSKEELLQKRNKVLNLTRIENEKGENIMYKDCFI